MKRTIKHVAPWLAAAAVGGAIALAPIASADTNPLVRMAQSHKPVCARLPRRQPHEADTTNGFRDVPL